MDVIIFLIQFKIPLRKLPNIYLYPVNFKTNVTNGKVNIFWVIFHTPLGLIDQLLISHQISIKLHPCVLEKSLLNLFTASIVRGMMYLLIIINTDYIYHNFTCTLMLLIFSEIYFSLLKNPEC
jgi:hypothetical protein